MHINENTFKVRYAETDQMGIVHHSNYYVWFEMGRTEFLSELGYSYGEFERKGCLLPVIETHCVYKKPAKYEDMVTVKTMVGEMKGVRISFKYEVYSESGELIAHGDTAHAFVNSEMKPINVKKTFPDIYEKLVSSL